MTRDQVATLLRHELVTGNYRPGDRLPSREALAARIPAGYVTIQHAIGQLEDEGFVVSRHGSGTFVTAAPPHLCHYGMLVVDDEWALRRVGNRFHDTLRLEAERFNRQQAPRRILLFQDVMQALERPGALALAALLQHHRLAGALFPDASFDFMRAALAATPRAGRVTAALPELTVPGMVHLVPDREAFLRLASARLAAQGCRRLAVLTTATNLDFSQQQLPRRVAEVASGHGMTTQPWWTVPLDPELPASVHCVVRLLFDRAAAERPDGLIIEDDHMVEAAALALHEAGLGGAVAVIGYCNHPNRPPAAVPLTRLGLDCRALLAAMVATIDAQISGQPPAPVTWVAPIFADEFAARYGAD
jgi:hypothetical protein